MVKLSRKTDALGTVVDWEDGCWWVAWQSRNAAVVKQHGSPGIQLGVSIIVVWDDNRWWAVWQSQKMTAGGWHGIVVQENILWRGCPGRQLLVCIVVVQENSCGVCVVVKDIGHQ